MVKYYRQLESFSLPNSAVRWAIDAISTDGRLMIVNGTEILQEEKPRSHKFERVANLASDPPGVLRISPSSVKAAIVSAAGNSLLIFEPQNGNIISTIAANAGNFFFDAEWYDDSVLAITEAVSGEGPTVKLLNLTENRAQVVLRNIGGASGGVTFSLNGSMFAGNGLSSEADDETGLIKAYSQAVWQQAWDDNQPINFEDETIGSAVANLLSGAYLGFDRFDNFHVGGGDVVNTTPDNNYAAVIFQATLEDILSNQGTLVTILSPRLPQDAAGMWQKLDPDSEDLDPDSEANNMAWLVHANRLTGELLLTPFEDAQTLYNYALVNEEVQQGMREVLFEANYQLGDNPGFYPSAFVNFDLTLPLPLPDLSSFAGDLVLLIETQHMETFNGQSRHPVSLEGIAIGNLEDPQNQSDNEKFSFNISRGTLETVVASVKAENPKRHPILAIKCQQLQGGLSDDFVLRKYGYRVTI